MFRQRVSRKTLYQQQGDQEPWTQKKLLDLLGALGPNAIVDIDEEYDGDMRVLSIRISVGVLGNIMRGNLVVNGQTSWYDRHPVTSVEVECKSRFLPPEMSCDLIVDHIAARAALQIILT